MLTIVGLTIFLYFGNPFTYISFLKKWITDMIINFWEACIFVFIWKIFWTVHEVFGLENHTT